jgi:hypothetical protein
MLTSTLESSPTVVAPWTRIFVAGLAAGLVVNLIDIPNSALLVAPDWTAFLSAHGVTPNVPAISAFYTTLHFAYGIAIAWSYRVLAARDGATLRTALVSSTSLLALHRAFGFGMVVMGIMPLGIYLRFSASMVIGSLVAGVLARAILERGHAS